MRLFESIKNNLKEASDGEIEKLKIELRSRIEDLHNDNEIPELTDDDINNIANKIKGEGFFISNNIFADDDDEYEWEQINMYLDNKIRDYVKGNLKESELEHTVDYEKLASKFDKNTLNKIDTVLTHYKDYLNKYDDGVKDIIGEYCNKFGNDYVIDWYEGLMSTEEFIKEVRNGYLSDDYYLDPMREAEHPLDWKKYEVTIKRNDARGNFTTIVVNKSEDAVRDYITSKGYEVVNIKELGYPGGNPENKNELQNKANKVVRNMTKIRESQTQEIDAVLKALKEKNPNIEKYLNEYYKAIADTEPRPAYDKEKDRMDPAWENWNKTTNNVLYSREAWDNFTKWVKEKYGENLNETEELKEGSDYWNDKFGQEALDEYKNNQDKNGIPKGETPFKVGDPVYYSYLSDNNEHNGVVGNIEWLRKYQYYPFGHKGDSDTVIYKWQGSIKYPDGSTESIGDAYAKGGGVTSPLRIAPKEFKPGDKIPWDYKLGEAEETKKGPTLEEDEYNAVDYFLTDSKMYDSGFYLKQDKNMKDYFVDAEDNNKKYSLKNGLHVIYEAMVPEYIAEYPKDIQKGLEKVMRKYLGDQVGDEIKSWCSKPKKEAESIKTVCGLEDGKSYWAYISKHGLGPGTIPNDVEATCVCDLPETGKTLFCVDRQLTPEELDKYELALFDNSYFNKYPEVVKELMALK